jgi:CO/xanthine dehydrogenase FAD-binding subunit
MTIHRPQTLAEAVAVAAEHPGAHLLAGGTDTMVEINFSKFKPEEVIALRQIAELHSVTIGVDAVRIGSGLPYKAMESGELARLFPALAQAARTVGSPQIRATGTLGGNLGTCSPAGDGLPVLAALDAMVHLVARDGERSVPVSEFMVGVKKNARQPGEIITAVTLPRTQGFQGYSKVGVRNAMVISVASACLVHDRGTASVRLALGAVGPTIIRCRDAEAWLAGQMNLSGELTNRDVTDDIATEFSRRASSEAKPISDHRSTADYRRHAVGVLASRLLRRAAS